MNIILPDGFVIHHAETLEGLVRWNSIWSDGGNIPLGLTAERGTRAAMLPDFFPAGLLLFGPLGRFTRVPEGQPEHTRMHVMAYTKDHAVHAFRRMLGLSISILPAPAPRTLSAGQRPPDGLHGPGGPASPGPSPQSPD